MALRAAEDVRAALRRVLGAKEEANLILAAAESQTLFIRVLAAAADIPWERVNAFNVDDFWAPGIPDELAVVAQTRRELYDHVPLKSASWVDCHATDPESERARYEALITQYPPDVACLGVGESGHVAFNEPGDTDFDDPLKVRVIDVCEASKAQLMGDPNFRALGLIPDKGITVTLSELMRCPHVFAMVPYRNKAAVIQRLLASPVTPDLPASLLKTKPGARLYLDADSYSLCAG